MLLIINRYLTRIWSGKPNNYNPKYNNYGGNSYNDQCKENYSPRGNNRDNRGKGGKPSNNSNQAPPYNKHLQPGGRHIYAGFLGCPVIQSQLTALFKDSLSLSHIPHGLIYCLFPKCCDKNRRL